MTSASRPITRGRIRQSVCRWCFDATPLETLAANVAAMGFAAIDLVVPADFPILKRHNLIGSMTPSHTITKGLNNPENHEECLALIRTSIDATSAAGFPNVICFSGNREPHISDEQGAKNTAHALKKIIGYAEQKNITLHIETLNSKVDHPGYMCDHSAWAAGVVKAVSSPNFKMLFDLYHMQVQEGDLIASIQKYADCIGHYHTAGVPGRHELDEHQELNYPAIMHAILKTGFQGFVAQEFLPTRDPMQSLHQAAAICDV